jgi:pimeloyl-ACP methyl ester carboxylesterase
MKPRRPVLLALLTLLCAGTALAAEGRVTLRMVPDTLRADAGGIWNVDVVLENGLSWGFYADSLSLEWVNTDPDRGTHARSGVVSLPALLPMFASVSGGESQMIQWNSPADFERGTLRLRIVGHDANQPHLVAIADARVLGSALGEAHPPQRITAGGRSTDLTVLPAETTPGPALLVVPPAGKPGRSLMRWAGAWRARGYTVGLVSLPGSGRSDGEEDAAGPASVALVRAALDRLAAAPGVEPTRVVAWGQREGATTLLLAAAGRTDLAGVVAQDASFDPWANWRALDRAQQERYTALAGRDSADWRARSPLAVADRIAAPVLVLQTADAGLPGSDPAEAFATRRAAAGLYIESRLSDREPRPMRDHVVTRIAQDFLARRTGLHP